MNKYKLDIKKIIIILLALGVLAAAAVLAVNAIVIASARESVVSVEKAGELDGVDCIMVLGCGVRTDGKPTAMLRDRVNVGIRVYETGVSGKMLMSGDHSRVNYDEVNVMKALAEEAGVEADAVFCDHAGFSTYESMYRARDIFQVKKMIIVTQSYHLPRALYIARHMGIEAYGVSATERDYGGQIYRDARELLARVKDVFTCIVKPAPTYLGDVIPISGPGSLTDG